MNTFNYDNLRLAIKANENAKKSLTVLVQKFERNKPIIEKQLREMRLLNHSMEFLLGRLEKNQIRLK